ncbi:hypothetical protein HT136_21280 [Novosphingobium profundi]|uniref:hypothetical protein n=1 Tax=Novosphingobium profundi TaxID=1774954 RepID=UPI001BDA85A2|nr:hypothetical protein [Novosphingobium profundi]MBT0670906.1 hypothetical protein [Novosphingobium profundi]
MSVLKPVALAVTASFVLGGLTGAAMPTRMKPPIGPDLHDRYAVTFDPSAPAFYIEPGPQDLTPVHESPKIAQDFAMESDHRTSAVAPVEPTY